MEKLIYLSHIRPNIVFAVSMVNQIMHTPYGEHLAAIYQILRSPKKGLLLKKCEERGTKAYTDADWA